MKKTIIGIIITTALTFTASADKKHHNDKHSQHTSKHSSYHKKSKHSSHRTHHKNSYYNHHNSHSRQHNSHSKHYSSHGHVSLSTNRTGHYEYTTKKVWIPERCQQVWVPATYEYRRNHCGQFIRVMTCKGYYHDRITAGYYDYQTVKVWRQPACSSRNTISFNWHR